MDIGLLLLRLTVGLTLAAHGTQKLFGWFGGPGLDAIGQFLVMLGFSAGRTMADESSPVPGIIFDGEQRIQLVLILQI
jgi:uncharacterized membrane protein YphA (DoxX/SURF4 family)